MLWWLLTLFALTARAGVMEMIQAVAAAATAATVATVDPALIVMVVLILVGCVTLVGFGIYAALPERYVQFYPRPDHSAR